MWRRRSGACLCGESHGSADGWSTDDEEDSYDSYDDEYCDYDSYKAQCYARALYGDGSMDPATRQSLFKSLVDVELELHHHPRDARCHVRRAIALSALRQYEAAVEAFRKAISLDGSLSEKLQHQINATLAARVADIAENGDEMPRYGDENTVYICHVPDGVDDDELSQGILDAGYISGDASCIDCGDALASFDDATEAETFANDPLFRIRGFSVHRVFCGWHDELIAAFRRLQKKNGDTVLSPDQASELYEELDDDDIQLGIVDGFVKVVPCDPWPHGFTLRSDLCWNQVRYSSNRHYATCVRNARQFHDRREYDKELGWLTKAIDASSSHVNANANCFLMRSEAYLCMKSFHKALDDAKAAQRLHCTAEAYCRIGEAQEALGNLMDAERAFRLAANRL